MARRAAVLVELRREGSGRLVAVYDDGSEVEREPAGPPRTGAFWTRRRGHNASKTNVFVHGQRIA